MAKKFDRIPEDNGTRARQHHHCLHVLCWRLSPWRTNRLAVRSRRRHGQQSEDGPLHRVSQVSRNRASHDGQSLAIPDAGRWNEDSGNLRTTERQAQGARSERAGNLTPGQSFSQFRQPGGDFLETLWPLIKDNALCPRDPGRGDAFDQ